MRGRRVLLRLSCPKGGCLLSFVPILGVRPGVARRREYNECERNVHTRGPKEIGA